MTETELLPLLTMRLGICRLPSVTAMTFDGLSIGLATVVPSQLMRELATHMKQQQALESPNVNSIQTTPVFV